MGRRERRSLESNLVVLLLHLLKWQFQPEQRSGIWEGSILEHRRRIQKPLRDSPSLHVYLTNIVPNAYTAATKQAKAETGLPLPTFAPTCPYEVDVMRGDDFLPD